MPLAGKRDRALRRRPAALFGVSITLVATIPFVLIGADTSFLAVGRRCSCAASASGCRSCRRWPPPSPSLAPDQIDDATPQLNVLQRVGGSIGTAVLAVVLQRALVAACTRSKARRRRTGRPSGGRRLTALAIVPCIVLLRAERPAREVKGDSGVPPPDVMAEAVAA